MATLELKNIDADCELIMFDVFGKEVKRIGITKGTVLLILDRGNLKNGMYFYNLFNDDNNKATAKGTILIE